MKNDLPPQVVKVQKELSKYGLECHFISMGKSCRSALQAAEALDCQLGQIAKSLIFKTEVSQKPILVITSGANQVDPMLLGKRVDEPVQIAKPEYVQERTGYQVGGVPPLGFLMPIHKTFIDQDLFRFQSIWASAGAGDIVFAIPPQKLLEITRAEAIKVT